MIGIRREDKNPWERRVPLTPEHVAVLARGQHLRVRVQTSPIRVFPDAAYEAAGAEIAPDLSGCRLVLGVKEIPVHLLTPGAAYLFFAHVVKGQAHNMPMLRRLMELGCTLVDYERITDDRGHRLIFFGLQAGHSGMIDTLWALGERLSRLEVPTPFASIRQALRYASLAEAQTDVAAAGERIAADGLPRTLAPLVVGFTGYGNTYRGAAEIFDLLPFEEIPPEDLHRLMKDATPRRDRVYKVVFREHHTVEPISDGAPFDLAGYMAHPEGYRGVFDRYLPHLSVLVNCVYWEPRYPRLVTRETLKRMFADPERARLRVIGDISCDIEGAVECTVRATNPGDPVFVYDPATGQAPQGLDGPGVVVLAVDNLPCELPADASEHFSEMLLPFVPALARCDWDAPLEDLALPHEILRALILHRGQLTPAYAYLESHLPR